MLRAQMGLAQRLYVNVYSTAGVAANPTTNAVSVTATVTRLSDGVAQVTNGAATYNDEPGVFFYDLSPADSTSQIDTLTVDWAYTLDGEDQTQTDTVDVVAGRLAPLRQVDDSLDRGGTASNYTARRVELALTAAESLFEAATSKCWTTRFGRSVLDGPSWCRGYSYRRAHILTLPVYPVTALRGVTVNDVAVSTTSMEIYPDGRLYSPTSWATGYRNIQVDYEYGEASTPPAVQRAVAILASSILADGPFDDRGFGVTTDGGFVRLLTAGVGGALFSIPEVQSAVRSLGRTKAERILAVDVG